MSSPHLSSLIAALLCAAGLLSLLGGADRVVVEGGSAEEKAAGQTWAFTPDPALPDVLLIGDSISIGYTLLVRSRLAGKANVFRPLDHTGKAPANGGDTARGLEQIDAWLLDRRWRVIHFNFGLHDLKYLDEKGTYVSPERGKQVTTLATYEANLRQLVARLRKTGATLVWASTTPVPEGSAGRVKGDEIAYNAVAKRVMEQEGVLINDLCGLVAARLREVQKPKNVHFTDQGSQLLAEAVTATITAALAGPAVKTP